MMHARLFAAVLLTGAPAYATQVLPVSLAEMTRDSEVIVHARVGPQEVRWQDGRAVTLTEIEVLAALKGELVPGDLTTIFQVGGTAQGVTFRIPGALRFERDEEMVFFAKRYQGMLVSYGMGLGKYVVRRASGHVSVAPSFGDVAFVGGEPDRAEGALDTLLASIRREVRP
jgi:hypothetical protein